VTTHELSETGAEAETDRLRAALAPDPDRPYRLCLPCLERQGTCRMGMRAERMQSDGSIETDLVCPPDGEGGPGVAHGGWTAGALDEIVGHLPMLNGALAVTGELKVRFVRPVPVARQLRAHTRLARRDGSRWYVESTLRLASTDAVLAVAGGIMVERDINHFARHRAWLAEQDAAGEAN
jgi:acyl-coenzyme A thioesterase PaaI-like protein